VQVGPGRLAGAAVAVVVDHESAGCRALGLEPDLGPARAQACRAAKHGGAHEAWLQASAAVENRAGEGWVEVGVLTPLLGRTTEHAVVAARNDVADLALRVVVDLDHFEARVLDPDDLAADRHQVGVARQLAGAEARAVDDDAMAGEDLVESRQGPALDGAAQPAHAIHQPG